MLVQGPVAFRRLHLSAHVALWSVCAPVACLLLKTSSSLGDLAMALIPAQQRYLHPTGCDSCQDFLQGAEAATQSR